MASLKTALVRSTRSGIYIREDAAIGLVAFSPYTGLIYAIHSRDAVAVRKWLLGGRRDAPDPYLRSLGAGWAVPMDEGTHRIPHLLPDLRAWDRFVPPSLPLLINWFVTGECPLACRYCYAEDLMRGRAGEARADDLKEIADSILRLKPLSVVLTGGDPLFTPHLRLAVELLSGNAGVIVDTSGYTFTAKHLELFKRHRVTVRISLDSERPRTNDAQRPLSARYPAFRRSGRTPSGAALSALCACLDAGIPVTVQTVATRYTVNDLISLGDKLYRLGVHSWRIFRVAWSSASAEGYSALSGDSRSSRHIRGKGQPEGPYHFNFQEVLAAYSQRWKRKMAIQVTLNEAPNSVILVGPDGTFYTESSVAAGKIVIDRRYPKRPSLRSVQREVDMRAHANRYFNLTSTPWISST